MSLFLFVLLLKINHYLTAIKTVQNLTEEKVRIERGKLIEEIALINSKWESYLLNFTAFRLKHGINHEKAVKKEFKKVYGLQKMNNRLKWINYFFLKKIKDILLLSFKF